MGLVKKGTGKYSCARPPIFEQYPTTFTIPALVADFYAHELIAVKYFTVL